MGLYNDPYAPDDTMGPRRRGIIQALDPSQGQPSPAITGGLASLPSAPQAGPSGDGHLQALSIYNTSNMTPEQRTQWQNAQSAQQAQEQAGFNADGAYLSSHGGNWGNHQSQFNPQADVSPAAYGGTLVGGSQFDAQQAGGSATGAAPTTAGATAGGTHGQYASALQGFDSGKLADPTHTTPKYTFARIAQDYAPTPDGYAQMIKDPRFAQAGFTPVGKDSIRLPDGTVVDVGLSFGSGGGKGWWWGDQSGGPGASGAPAAGGGAATAGSGLNTALGAGTIGGDAMGNVQTALGKLQQPGLLQQLIAQLSRGGQ